MIASIRYRQYPLFRSSFGSMLIRPLSLTRKNGANSVDAHTAAGMELLAGMHTTGGS